MTDFLDRHFGLVYALGALATFGHAWLKFGADENPFAVLLVAMCSAAWPLYLSVNAWRFWA